MNTTRTPNRLVNEKSPYLLQHSQNPVDWYPWCDEAFKRANNEDKPIFLSIGYSTCHWCHVMERESFEDHEIAELLNKYYISIKVDREERPDIDQIYMSFCQAITGNGGWPLTIIMSPDQKPFFAGTYFPKIDKYGRPGLLKILTNIKYAWENNREELLKSSDDVIQTMLNSQSQNFALEIEDDIKEKAFRYYIDSFDPEYGGFGSSPKFPTPHILYYLLRYYKITGNISALEMVEKTLQSMYKGGIFDHIGYGFSRYSTDNKWLIPHFEKMLYDNALLSIAYLEAYQITNDNLYKDIAEKIFTYLLRDMSSEEGGFFSAEDADSEDEEGKFYLWTTEEVYNILGKNDGEFFCNYYGISQEGNFQQKKCIPNLLVTDLNIIEEKSVKEKLQRFISKLFNERKKRIPPYKDDMILTGWNGLAIAALSYGGRVLNNKDYIGSAIKCTDFIFDKLIDENKRLLARYRDGNSAYKGYLEDYAYLIWGLIELYEATLNSEYLIQAFNFNNNMLDIFWDNKSGGFYIYGNDGEQLILRPKESFDFAMPSGNSIACLNILRLAEITHDTKLQEVIKKQFEYFSNKLNEYPQYHCHFLNAFLFNISSPKTIIISGNKHDSESMLQEINKHFLPFSIFLFSNNSLSKIVKDIDKYKAIENNPTTYICENFTCKEPITDTESLRTILNY